MWKTKIICISLLYLTKLVIETEGITYLRGVSTPKFTTRKIPLEKWLENENWRLAPYGNKEFTKILRQWPQVIRNKYFDVIEENFTVDDAQASYVMGLWLTTRPSTTRRLKKKEKIKMGKLKLVKENVGLLEEKLGLTTTTMPTTSSPTTTPYTGITSRKSASPYFDPDYVYDINWMLKPKKKLKRDITSGVRQTHTYSKAETRTQLNCKERMERNGYLNTDEVSFNNERVYQHKVRKEGRCVKCGKPKIDSINNFLLPEKGDTPKEKLRKNFYKIKLAYRKSNGVKPKRRKRSIDGICRRPTKRPFLSRKFKSQSRKQFRQDARFTQQLAEIAGNITIVPDFKYMKKLIDMVQEKKMSTLFYVFNNVAYFGSVPSHLLVQNITTTSKIEPYTYELGATQILDDNIFKDEAPVFKKKVSPSDVEIPNINLDPQVDNVEPIGVNPEAPNIEHIDANKDMTDVSKNIGEVTESSKQKRTRKKKTTHIDGLDTETKKTRAKRKTTVVEDEMNSSKEPTEIPKNKTKGKKRKIREIDVRKHDFFYALAPVLCYVHNTEINRKKREVNDDNELKTGEETQNQNNGIEDKSEKLNPFGRFKKALKDTKHGFVSFVREKKETFVDMPRRVKFIAREMYLDGKFFIQELKEVPSRMKADIAEKKEYFKLFYDLFKIMMPHTEKGEVGGTTPETKIVNDPKQYVKNPEDIITPDLSDTIRTQKREAPEEKKVETNFKKASLEETTKRKVTEATKITPTIILQNDPETTPFYRKHDVTQATESILQQDQRNRNDNKKAEPIAQTVETKTNPVVLKETFNTKVMGPDYVPTNTRLVDDFSKTTLSNVEEVIKKVNDKDVFDNLESTMKNKKFMDNVFDTVNYDNLRDVMKKVDPSAMFRQMNPETIGRMGNLVKSLDPDTLKRMQNLAVNVFSERNGGSDMTPRLSNTNPPKIERNR